MALKHISKRVRFICRAHGLRGLCHLFINRYFPVKSQILQQCQHLFADKTGFEIGGPSPIFRADGILPVYPVVKHLDNCNFSNKTHWEGNLAAGNNFAFDPHHAPGRQYLADAVSLPFAAGSHDFVLSSHVLEHVANPLKALTEWQRVMKDDGGLLLVLPHHAGSFDHRRPLTQWTHLVDDFSRNTGEADQTHVPEVLELHDYEMNFGEWKLDELKRCFQNNLETRCVHHHVFNTPLVLRMLDFVKMQIIAVGPMLPFHIIAVAQKLPPGQLPANESFLAPSAAWAAKSPFASDKSTASCK